MKRLIVAVALVACGSKHPRPTPEVDPWAASGIDWTQLPEPGPEPTFTAPAPETFMLANGVVVVVVENHRLPLVSVRAVCTRAGAREDGAKLGLAAMTAALLLEGAGDLDARALPEAVERLGADLDTGLSEDAATIWLDTLASTLDDSLALVADVLRRPRLDAKDFERIRSDELEDLRQRPQEPRRVANLVFDHLVLGDHPYGQPASGFIRTVSKLTIDDVRAFWRDHYAPGTTTIVVAGDVTRAALEPMLERTLGGWKPPKPPLPAPVAPALAAEPSPAIVLVDRPGAAQSIVMFGQRGRAASDPQYYAAEVINTAVGGSFAARLNDRLREELGYTYGMYAAFWRGEWGGTWAVTSSLETPVTVDGLREALQIIEDARVRDLPASELADTQSYLIRQRPQAFETNAGIAGEVQALVVLRQPLSKLDAWNDGVRAVTAAEARALAAEAWDGISIVVVGDRAAIGDGLASLGLPITYADAEGNAVE